MKHHTHSVSFLDMWLQVLLAICVTILLVFFFAQLWWPAIAAFLVEHWLLMSSIGSVVVLGASAHKTIPAGWRAFKAISHHQAEVKEQDAHLGLLMAATEKVKEGYNLDYHNAKAQASLKIANPYASRSNHVNVQQVDETLQLPVPRFPEIVRYADVANRVPSELSLLGIHADGNLEIVSPDNYKTAWFVGGSNTGKTNTVYGKVADAVRWGAKLIICDNHAHKSDSLANKLKDFHGRLLRPVAQTDIDIKDAVIAFLREFKRRRDFGSSCDEKWLIVADEVNATSEHVVKISDEEIQMFMEEYGIKIKENFVKLRVFFQALAQTCGYESRGFEMFGYFISQKVAGLSWLRNAMMTVFVHGLLMESEAKLAANHNPEHAKLIMNFKKGRTLVYGYEFEQPLILQQPKYDIGEVVDAVPTTPILERSDTGNSNQTVSTLGTPWEQAQEVDGMENEPEKDATSFELKKMLDEIGKMKTRGKSNAEILKHYELHPAGRNNTNLGTLVEIIEFKEN